MKTRTRFVYNSKLGNIARVHKRLEFAKNRVDNGDEIVCKSNNIRVWSRVVWNSKYQNKCDANEHKVNKNELTDGHTFKSYTSKLSSDDSVGRLAGKQVLLQNTFDILGQFGEDEINQIICPKGHVPHEGQGDLVENHKDGGGEGDSTSSSFMVPKNYKNTFGPRPKGSKNSNLACTATCTTERDKNAVLMNLNRVLQNTDTHTKIDVKSSVQITRAVLNGNNSCIRHVNILDIKDKCVDLKRCISQQKTVFGFLPITNLKRMRIGQVMTPNRILCHNTFDPVLTHRVVRDMGGKNFERAKYITKKSPI